MTAQQGKEEVGLSSKKQIELSGGRSRKLILGLNRGRCAWRSSRETAELLSQDAKSIKHLLKKDEIPLLDFRALLRCVFEQIKNIIK